jgi:hypothetical protein
VPQQPDSVLDRLIVKVSTSRTIGHTHNRKQSPWTTDQLVAEAATYTLYNRQNRRTSMPSTRFEFADLYLRSHGHRDRQAINCVYYALSF